MSPDDPSEPDSEVFADPVPEPDSAPTHVVDGAAEWIDTTRSSSRALVPSDPFRRYLFEIRKYPALSRDEELDLARRYRQTGDREALFRLITSNLMLVVRVAMSFRRAARNTLDLIQEGNVGLMHLKLAYGQSKLRTQDIRKTDDEIYFESLFIYLLGTHINPYGSFTLRTQFAPGY